MSLAQPEGDPFTRLISEIDPGYAQAARFHDRIASINRGLVAPVTPLDPGYVRELIPELHKIMPRALGERVYVTAKLGLIPLYSRTGDISDTTLFTKELSEIEGLSVVTVKNKPQLCYSFLCTKTDNGFRAPRPGEVPTHIGVTEVDQCYLEKYAETQEEAATDLERLLPDAKEQLDTILKRAKTPLEVIQSLHDFDVAHPNNIQDNELKQQENLLADYVNHHLQPPSDAPHRIDRKGLFLIADEDREYFSLSDLRFSSQRVTGAGWIEGVKFIPEIVSVNKDKHHPIRGLSVPAAIVRECAPTSTSADDYYRRIALPLSGDVTIS